jgi:hypothetical protein
MGEDGDKRTGPNETTSIFGRWLSGFLLAAALILFDPLGISSAADRASERILMAVAAHLALDSTGGGADTRGQKAITVVLVDDAFMQAYRDGGRAGTWPIPRADQFDLILAPILDRAPYAIFVDWVFHSDRVESNPEFNNVLKQLEDQIQALGGSTRIMFSDRPDRLESDRRRGCPFRFTSEQRLAATSQSHREISELWPEAAWAERVPVRWWGPAHRYPLAPLALATEDTAAVGDCAPFAPEARALPSPALALFSHWCEAEGRKEGHGLCQTPIRGNSKLHGYPIHQLPSSLAEASAPFWLARPSAIRMSIADHAGIAGGTEPDPCAGTARVHPLRQILGAFRLRIGREEEEVPFNPCFGIDTVSATALRTVMLDGEGQPAGLNDRALDALFHDRLVLIGTDLDSAPDRAESPVNGPSPAVLLHAAALENLITEGTRRTREPPDESVPWGLVASLLVAGVAAFPLSPILEGLVEQDAAAVDRRRQRAPLLSFALVTACLALALWVFWLAGARSGLWIPLTGIPLAGLALWAILAGEDAFARPARHAARLGGVVLPVALAGGILAVTHWAPANWISGLAAKLTMLGGLDEMIETGWQRAVARWRALRKLIPLLGVAAFVVAMGAGALFLAAAEDLLPWALLGAGIVAAIVAMGYLEEGRSWVLGLVMVAIVMWQVPEISIGIVLFLVTFLSALTLMVILSLLVARWMEV